MIRNVVLAGCLVLVSSTANAQFAKDRGADTPRSPKKTQPKFELKDGDRVVFLGNTLIEREQKYGYWETMLTARYPDRKIIFRNLGWDGDTVWAESRGLFDPPAKGYERMLAHVGRIKPTVLFIGYGNNEAFAGEKGLPAFIKQYNKLLDDLTKVSEKGVRFVLLSPIRHVDHGPPLPNARKTNAQLEIFTKGIKQIAIDRKTRFVSLFRTIVGLSGESMAAYSTSTGNHLTESGYKQTTFAIESVLCGHGNVRLPSKILRSDHTISISATGKINQDHGARITEFRFSPGKISFNIHIDRLERFTFGWQLTVTGLQEAEAKYRLLVDGKDVSPAHGNLQREVKKTPLVLSAKELSSRCGFFLDDEDHGFEQLRQAIIAKNRLYFHSWRPQNITYLLLFRKHEQGQNAKDVQEFERLVAEKEKEIDRLKKPVTRTYELIRVKPKK